MKHLHHFINDLIIPPTNVSVDPPLHYNSKHLLLDSFCHSLWPEYRESLCAAFNKFPLFGRDFQFKPPIWPQFLSTYENMKRWLVANIYHRSRINQKEIKFIGKIRDMPCKLSFSSGLRCNQDLAATPNNKLENAAAHGTHFLGFGSSATAHKAINYCSLARIRDSASPALRREFMND